MIRQCRAFAVPWDKLFNTNPTPCVTPDGGILLYYRSAGKLGLATTAHPDQPFTRYGDRPIFDPGDGLKVEDPCVFYLQDHYEMVCKDLTGKLTNEFHSAVHLTSPDGISWTPMDPVKAWSRSVNWDDGTTTIQGNIERPFVLMHKGEPAFLFAATADGPGPKDDRPGFAFADNTWNMVIPLSDGQ